MSPFRLGSGERLFEDVGTLAGYECVEQVCSPRVVHVRLVRRS